MEISARAILLGLALLGGGCTTSNLADVAPTAAVTPTPRPDDKTPAAAPAAEAVSAASGGPANTGVYPNLNSTPQAAAGQLAQSETDAEIAALKAARAGQGNAAPVSAAEIARLKKLARSHGAKALEEIEN